MGRGQPEHGQAQKGQTIGQSPRATEQARPSEAGKAPSVAPTRKSEQEQKGRPSTPTKGQTTGQATQKQQKQAPNQPQQTQSQPQNRPGASTKGQTTGQATPKQAPNQAQQTQPQPQNRAGTTTQGQSTTSGAATQSQTNTAQSRTQGTVAQSLSGRTTVTAQQQTRIQQSVLSASNVPRVNINNINFTINTGVVVPSRFRVVAVSTFPVLIDEFPAYRDDSFFVVEDEIIIVDRSHRVVDVIPAGPRTHFARRAVGNESFAALNLGPDEIRVVQQTLIERGLLSGEADGVFGDRTREALITFQRQQGLQTSGSIDTRTVAALGLSNKISQSATQSGPSTVGQGGNQNQQSTVGQGGQSGQTGMQQQQPSGSQTTTGQAPSGQQPSAQTPQNNQSTTGQAGQGTAPVPAQPSTTGQAPPSGHGNMPAPAQKPGGK
ncbi:MAG TPA: peptidoglycan-binding domain-containing protein [Bradyrhizobium sp.]|uniref:peptidoglycan-binding domain-containing protein n=1 Tax=Bradyrhizobium sp. TaxID=376 RepID=UPI002D1425AE|nr:peptidoglycan-binding domain-containing protein [Bradyrhizobium sp.]HLZ04202.1 peptidoglycan-binding domain-containing protein [Bradyrhizobium sp.]